MITRQRNIPPTAILGVHQTHFDYAHPDPAQVRLADVAMSLSNTCRYRGLVPPSMFMSDAEHAVIMLRVAEILWPEIQTVPQAAWAFLHHDDPETFTCDMPGPAKLAFRQLYGDAWDRFELTIADVVYRAFSVDAGWLDLAHAKSADVYAYELERRFLFGWDDVVLPPELEDVELFACTTAAVPLVPSHCIGVSPPVARAKYLAEVRRLASQVGRPDLAEEAEELMARLPYVSGGERLPRRSGGGR